MPNLWAHIIFGEQVLHLAEQDDLTNQQELKQFFNLGCQGPDFLLYHNFYPWKKDTRVSDLGTVMHTQQCDTFLMEMIKHIESYPKDDPAYIYALGFITHYVLDRHVHPYVYAKSGYEKWHHQRFEVMMDTIIARELKGMATWKAYAWKQIDVGQQLPESIVDMFQKVTSRVFPEEYAKIHPDDWNEAYRHMTQAHRLFRDPYGVKRVLLLKQTDPFIYKRKVPDIDIMNVSNERWSHPTDQTLTYTYSVWDLWDLALDNAISILSLLLGNVNVPSSDQQFAELAEAIGNFSYDSGKPWAENHELQYAEPII